MSDFTIGKPVHYNHGSYVRYLDPKNKSKLTLEDLTFNKKFSKFPKKSKQFWFEGGWYRVPRSSWICASSSAPENYTKNSITEFNIDSLSEAIRLDSAQEILYRKIREELDSSRSCIVKAPPGSGKTFIGLFLILALKLRTIIIINNISLGSQWAKLIKNLFGFECGTYNSKKKLVRDITIASVDSLIPRTADARNALQLLSNQFSFSIFDECHTMCSSKRSIAFSLFQSQYSVALSATPERIDGFHKALSFHFGKICEHRPSRESTAMFNPEVHFIFLPFKIPVTDNFNDLLNWIIHNDERNNIIADQICKHKNKNILLLSDRIKHLSLLQEKLKEKNIDCVKIVGSDKRDKIKIIETLTNEKKNSENSTAHDESSEESESRDTENSYSPNIILSTYLFFGTGLSISKLDTLILASPKKNKINLEQYCGRIFRKGSSSKNRRLIIDIVDMKSYTFRHFVNRKRYYESKKYDIQNIRIEPTKNPASSRDIQITED